MAILDGVYDDLVLAADRWYCVDELDIIGTFYQSASLWGSASDTFVASGGVLKVSSGGVVNQTTILYIGYMEVGSDGLANQTTVSSHGSMVVHKGGTANETTIMSGAVEVSSGGTANKATVNGGHIRMCDSGTANSVTVNKGLASVGVGGTLNVAVVNSGGYMFVGERVHSYAPGKATATSITVNDGGILRVFESGVANSITLASGATVHVSMGGMAECTLASGATVHISSGGTAAFTITSGASVYISSGGTILRNIINEEETWSVSEGVVAIETTVNSWGNMYVSSGGTANQTTVSGGKATMVVKPDGVANTTTVADGGLMYVSSGGTANDTTVNSAGIMRLRSGVTANKITVGDGGLVQVSSGATANENTVNSGGIIRVSSGATANDTTVNSGGTMQVSGGGTANDTTVNSGGTIRFYSGGTANDTTVNSGGTMFGSDGGILGNTTLSSGGTLTATGQLTLAEGAVFSAYDGAIIDFDISKLSPGKDAIVNDLSLIQGTPSYTVTVQNQAEGDYVLAEGAANFTGSMTVKSNKTEFASVTVGGAGAASDGMYYSLAVENGKLLFTVSTNVPDHADGIVTNSTAGEEGSFDEAATTDDWTQVLFSTDNTTYNYTDGLVATHAMEISGNGTSATTLSGGALYLDGNEASFSDLAFDGLLFGVKSAESGELEADGASLSFSGVVFTDSARVFGGADLSGTVTASIGDITIAMEEVDGGQARIFGAGRVAGGASLIVGNIDVSISCAEDGSFSNFFAGAEARSGFTGSIICEDIYSTIESGTFTYCGNGSQLRGEGTSVQNDSTLFIKDGTFNYFVYAGAFSAGGEAVVDGSTTLIITGGTFNSHVFGGCGANNSDNGRKTMVYGDTAVFVDTMEKEISFNGNIYAGSIGYGIINGSTTMTFTGLGENLHFAASSTVTGGSQMYKGTVEYVGGDKVLEFAGFYGDFGANVNNGFSHVAVRGSNVSFTASKVALNAVSSWTIEVGSDYAELAILKGMNSFRGDKLELTLADGAAPSADGWDVVAGTADTLRGWESFSQVTISGEDARFADGEWSTNGYRLYNENNTLKLASIA